MKTRIMIRGVLVIFTLISFPHISFSEVNAIPAKAPNVSANLPKANKIEPSSGISVDQLKEREKAINDIVTMKQDRENLPTFVEKSPLIPQLPIQLPPIQQTDGKNLLSNIDPELVQKPDTSMPIPDTGKIIGPPQIPIVVISPPRQQITPLPRAMLDWKNYYNPQMKYERFFIPDKALSHVSILWNNIAPQDNSYRFFGATFTMSATTTTIGEKKNEDSMYFSVL